MFLQDVEIVRRVTHQYDRFILQVANGRGNGKIGIGSSAYGIVDSREPESASAAFDGQIGISEDGYAVGSKSIADVLFPGPDIVIAEDGVALAALQPAEHFCALPGCIDGQVMWKHLGAYVVSREQDDVRVLTVDLVNCVAQQKRLGKFVEMNIAELSDCDSVECAWQAPDVDVPMDRLEPMALEFAGIEGEAAGAAHCSLDEGAS